jgi:acyl-coenzyme A synthetase/AMP-(fatty) acid ligase
MRGVRVSLAEVEERATAIPGVYDCAACVVDHPETGEALVLSIVYDQKARILLEEVRRHFPAHWTIDAIRLVSELPRTSTGKIARSSLSVLVGTPCSNLTTK